MIEYSKFLETWVACGPEPTPGPKPERPKRWELVFDPDPGEVPPDFKEPLETPCDERRRRLGYILARACQIHGQIHQPITDDIELDVSQLKEVIDVTNDLLSLLTVLIHCYRDDGLRVSRDGCLFVIEEEEE